MRVVLFLGGFGAVIIGMIGAGLFFEESLPGAICIEIAMFITAINSFALAYHFSSSRKKSIQKV